MKIAIWQQGYAVFGVGSTLEIALSEAASYCDPDSVCEPEQYVGQSLIHGNFYWAPCSDALAKYVGDHGGDVRVTVDGGILKLESEISR